MQPDPSFIRKAVDLPAVYVYFVKITLKTFHCIPCCKKKQLFFFFFNTIKMYNITIE